MASKKVEDKPSTVRGITTAEGLVRMGREYAWHDSRGFVHITDKGHALLGQQIRERVAEDREKGTWYDPYTGRRRDAFGFIS